MLGFNVARSTDAIYFAVRTYYAQAREEILQELSSPGYEDVIEDVFISNDFQDIQIKLKEGFKTDRQDVFELLAQGGTLLKVDSSGSTEAVAIKPSPVMRKYLGKR